MKKIKFTWSLILFCCIIWFTHPVNIPAAVGQPATVDNLRIDLRRTSALAATSTGYMRIFYDGEKIGVEYYDDRFVLQSKKSLNMELPIWGGCYIGENAYYLVEGQSNTAESDTAEVIRVIRYDRDWNKTGMAQITGNPALFGGQVRYPFDHGCVEIAEYNGTLYLVTGHEGYVDPQYRQGHQGFLMIAIDGDTMKGRIADCDLWHSFAQYISCKDDRIYVLEQSEGSRYTKLSRYDTATLQSSSIPVLAYGGNRDSAWAIPCYASVDGMAVSADHVLCLGTSIDQSEYDRVSSDTDYNIYLTVTPTADFSEEATTVKWLTNYNGVGKKFRGTTISKVQENRFLITWEESGTGREADLNDSLSGSILHYLFVDGAGNSLSGEFTAAAPVSDCQPIVKGSKIIYYAANGTMVNFYSIDAQTGAFSKISYRMAGECATWDVKDSVLTVSGTGVVEVDSSAWKSLRQKVKKIVIEGGITGISEGAFANFNKVTEIEIKPGVKSIGKQAFYRCESLKKITIPASVTSIGEDILWTGAYWTGSGKRVVKATIYAPKNSYALKYAKKNGISIVVAGEKEKESTADGRFHMKKAKISGIKKSYAYNGKAQKPKVTVKMGAKTLKKGTEYTVSYHNNKKTGKATVKIKGIRPYTGSVTKTFRIVPGKLTLSGLKSLKSGVIKVIWKKDSMASGYQIQYAGNAAFKKRKKNLYITGKSTGSGKLSGCLRNKTYYVRVRAYKTIDGKKCPGSWSRTLSVVCK